MDAERAAPDPDPAAVGYSRPAVQAEERVGPLLLTRYRKRDGRALLLYARRPEIGEQPPPRDASDERGR